MMALAGLLTLLFKSLIFAPIGWWPLAFVCLTPWLIVVGAAPRAPRVYAHSYLLGIAFSLINLRWLYDSTGLGYVFLAIYQAAYFPLMACPIRHAVRRRRLPLAVVVPIVWTGSEMVRAVALSGFPWFFLSHSLYDVLSLIQISDLVGAYGVSFTVAAVNGAVADLIFARWGAVAGPRSISSTGSARFSRFFAGLLLTGVLVYGWIQLGRDTITRGPKIAVIQGDYLSLIGGDEASDREKMNAYLKMMEEAAAQRPDVYLLPETPWIMYLNPEARDLYPMYRESFARLRDHAVSHNAYVVTGSASLELKPYSLEAKELRYNSAMVFSPDGAEPGRYDKVHLVVFGEMVPFRYGRLRFLYLWLNRLMPFSGPDGEHEYSLFPGKKFEVFNMTSRESGKFRFGVPICYEDVMPYVSREFVCGGHSEKRADFLLNISNDGWFGRGVQQPQHLAICVFRAVENRVGIARAVNTGISGFIQPDGRLHHLVHGGAVTRPEGNSGFAVAHVGVDSRRTLYCRYGDWFAWTCAFLWLLLYVDYWVVRARARDSELATGVQA